MSDLAAFLLARVAEDEAVAREVLEKVKPGASLYGIPTSPIYVEDAEGSAASSFFDRDYGQGGYTITAARVLAECEAKRQIVEVHSVGAMACYWTQDSMSVHEPGEACETLRHLALPYAEHPDFDPAWRL